MFKERKERGNKKSASKRGELMGLPFVFIISLIIAAVIVIFAVITIKNFACRGEQVAINVFVSDFRSEIEKAFYTTRGSQTIFRGTLPSKGCAAIEQVCLGFPDEARSSQFLNDDVWFEISAYRGQDKNLFLYPRDSLVEVGVQQAYKIPLMNVTQNPICFQSGSVEIALKNEGRYVNALKK